MGNFFSTSNSNLNKYVYDEYDNYKITSFKEQLIIPENMFDVKHYILQDTFINTNFIPKFLPNASLEIRAKICFLQNNILPIKQINKSDKKQIQINFFKI